MELNNLIYDYKFVAGDKAQYEYINSNDEEKILMVKILDSKEYKDGKVYVVCAHFESLKVAGLVYNELLSDHYFEVLPNGYKVALMDPDELDPFSPQFSVIIDNTKRK